MRTVHLIPALLFFFSCNDQEMITRLDHSTIAVADLDREIDRLIENAGVTGLAICVFNQAMPVYIKAFGYANKKSSETLQTNDVFYAASFSKAVFGYIVARLVADGQLDLDTPLEDYLDVAIPDIPVDKEFRSLAPLSGDNRHKLITARMCMSHTTGLPNWRWIEDDGKLKFLFDPGERYNYSGEGMMILQWVVEHITGRKLEDLAREMVFEPLGMDDSGYLWKNEFEDHYCHGHNRDQVPFRRTPETEDAAAAGSLVTTIEDYSKFIEHILQLESADSLVTHLMFTPNVRIRSKAQFGPLSRQDTTQFDDIALSYGLGWGLLSSPYGPGAFKEGHDEGFQHYSIIFPQEQKGIIIMTNSDNGESIFKELLEIALGDTFTPWQWEFYIPYDMEDQ